MFVIKNGEIADGTGKPSFRGDILIKGNAISAIGDFSRAGSENTIDVRGAQVVPGFIDVNTDSDHYLTLFTDPMQEDFLRQGVTSIIGGNCGASLAPLLYGSLESIRKWGNPDAINVDWHTMEELLLLLTRQGLGVNFGTLVGHATIRRALLGETDRDLTVRELQILSHIVSKALEEGALGLSTGLGYSSSRGVHASEISMLAALLKKKHGVYATHLRDERAGLLSSIAETIAIAKESGRDTIVSHFRPLMGFEKEFEKGLGELEKADAPIWFDGYPSDMSLTPLYTLLPDFARRGRLEHMYRALTEPASRERITKELPQLRGSDIRVVEAPYAPYLVGRTLGEFSANQGLSLHAGLMRLMDITKLRAVVLYRNVHMDLAIQSLRSPRAIVASNSPSFGEKHGVPNDRTQNVFPKFLSLMSYLNCMPFPEAVKKITSVPARIFGLRDRGILAEGMRADIVILRDFRVEHVFVNGMPALREDKVSEVRNGMILRSGT